MDEESEREREKVYQLGTTTGGWMTVSCIKYVCIFADAVSWNEIHN